MAGFGLTPAARSRVKTLIEEATEPERVTRVELLIVSKDPDGNLVERPLHQPQAIPRPYDPNGRDPAQDVMFLNENI